MTSVSEPKIQRLLISKIEPRWDDRIRIISDAGVTSLIASINELGVIKDAIHVRKARRADGESLILMAGGHRLAAAKKLQWDTIPARVWNDVTDDFARLMEIDDNIAGAELSALELSVFLAERKKVYERLHPETKAGAFKGNRHTGSLATEIISFTASVAEKRDLSPRHIRNLVAIGDGLSPREIAELSQSVNPIKITDLMKLVGIEDEPLRVDVVDCLKHGTVRNVGEAVRRLRPDAEATAGNHDAAEKAYKKLLSDWKRAPADVKRRFAEECGAEIAELSLAKAA